jgi:phosphomethylpyrimidine synthase
MKITQDVRDYAAAKGLAPEVALEQGMQDKAVEFRERGSTIYHEVADQGDTAAPMRAKSE